MLELKGFIEKIKTSDKRLRLFVILGVAGVILILLSELVPASTEKRAQQISDTEYSKYISALEGETQEFISSIDGVGRCRVMITLKDTKESVFAKNNEESSSDSSYSKNNEYVLYNGQNGDSPVLLKQYFPEVRGVAVVCDGADNTVVKEKIIESVSSLFDVSVSKISVSKYKN